MKSNKKSSVAYADLLLVLITFLIFGYFIIDSILKNDISKGVDVDVINELNELNLKNIKEEKFILENIVGNEKFYFDLFLEELKKNNENKIPNDFKAEIYGDKCFDNREFFLYSDILKNKFCLKESELNFKNFLQNKIKKKLDDNQNFLNPYKNKNKVEYKIILNNEKIKIISKKNYSLGKILNEKIYEYNFKIEKYNFFFNNLNELLKKIDEEKYEKNFKENILKNNKFKKLIITSDSSQKEIQKLYHINIFYDNDNLFFAHKILKIFLIEETQ